MKNTLNVSRDSNFFSHVSWKKIVARYQIPSIPRATWQLINSIVPYFFLLTSMYFLKFISWWFVLPLAVIASGLLVRIFIIFHDCCHGSFFKSNQANVFWGYVTGILTFTPFHQWRWEHIIHHSGAANLDKRGTGDISTMTVQEYLEASRWKRFSYRLSRNPIILFVLAPFFLFLIWQRFPNLKAPKRERLSVMYTNLGIVLYSALMMWIFGWQFYLIVVTFMMAIAGGAGIWLFYVQHQFEGVYWERNQSWDYEKAALNGSSFYKLPKILQWFSGNIGFHHIHHLSPKIPNYRLEKCHKSEPYFQQVKSITLFKSFKSFTYRLWDEQKKRLIGYRQLKQIKKLQSNTKK